MILQGPIYGYVVFKEDNKTTYSESAYVEIQCRQGYELVGDNRTYCQSDGTWSNSTVCKGNGIVLTYAIMIIEVYYSEFMQNNMNKCSHLQKEITDTN